MPPRPDGLPHEGKIVFSLGPSPSRFDVCTVAELATALALVYPKEDAYRIAEREAAFGLDRSGELWDVEQLLLLALRWPARREEVAGKLACTRAELSTRIAELRTRLSRERRARRERREG